MIGLTVALVAEEGKKILVLRTRIHAVVCRVSEDRAALERRSAVVLSEREGRPGRDERCGELRSPGMMNGKSVIGENASAGIGAPSRCA